MTAFQSVLAALVSITVAVIGAYTSVVVARINNAKALFEIEREKTKLIRSESSARSEDQRPRAPEKTGMRAAQQSEDETLWIGLHGPEAGTHERPTRGLSKAGHVRT